MYVHVGKKMFGKCDVVPELFHVETLFFHVDFLPLVPLQTYLVTGKADKKKVTGLKMRMSIKSVLYAWARTATFLGALILTILALVAIQDLNHGDSSTLTTASLFATACWLLCGALMLYPRRIKPRYQRACELATLANLSDIGWAALNVQYGREIDERPATTQGLS